MKIIAVSQRVTTISDDLAIHDAIDQRWYLFLAKCGVSPFLIPNNKPQAVNLLNINIEGVLFTGGNDHETRNETEIFLLNYAINKKIPVIGVCHGMQMLQRFFGITLDPIKNHIKTKQKIITQSGSRTVNSYQTLGTTTSVDVLKVLATSGDGIIKAVQHNDLPLYGIMWHPERNNPFDQQDIKFFQSVLGIEK
ncbi:MAG: hypothetical protein A3F17_05465 [Gammaproteobacteria bacterium RIFCSPHIGHO2_12_FULL_41_15]|nr:MAG: hypothetical protein A3F17_05465 [Gammaproteobacteria bacterium RIFCSPHIGHO2_12_FULL_41_15]